MMPHLAEEMWRALGHATLLVDEAWPDADPALLVDDTITLAIQVSGKMRGTVELSAGATQQEAEAAAREVRTEIGRASWRERGCRYVWIPAVAVSLKEKRTKESSTT